MPNAISKVIIPLLNAVKVITLAQVLVCNTIVTAVHNKILLTNHIFALSSEKIPDNVSTDSFIYANPKNNNPKPNKNLAIFMTFLLCDPRIIRIHHIAITGNVIASILNLNHIRVTIHGVMVVPIFAHRTIPIPCCRLRILAHTNPSINIITTVLLCNNAVDVSQTPKLFNNDEVYL